MTNRREFLQSGVAASILPLAMPALAAGAGARDLGALQLERFVVDTRFAESVEVARQAALRGIDLAEVSGDLTELWYRHFDLQWKRAPMTLAGMTDWHGLFVLETLAVDRGMRVLYRGEHAVAQQGEVMHAYAGPASLLEQLRTTSGTARWQVALGTAMTECPGGHTITSRIRMRTPVANTATRDEALYSWIIAPRANTHSSA